MGLLLFCKIWLHSFPSSSLSPISSGLLPLPPLHLLISIISLHFSSSPSLLQIDLTTFLTLTEEDLRNLGISTFGARRKMLIAIAELNARTSNHVLQAHQQQRTAAAASAEAALDANLVAAAAGGKTLSFMKRLKLLTEGEVIPLYANEIFAHLVGPNLFIT